MHWQLSIPVSDNFSNKMVHILNVSIILIAVLCLFVSGGSSKSLNLERFDVFELQDGSNFNENSGSNYRLARSLRSSMRVQGFCHKGYIYIEGIGCRRIVRRSGWSERISSWDKKSYSGLIRIKKRNKMIFRMK